MLSLLTPLFSVSTQSVTKVSATRGTDPRLVINRGQVTSTPVHCLMYAGVRRGDDPEARTATDERSTYQQNQSCVVENTAVSGETGESGGKQTHKTVNNMVIER